MAERFLLRNADAKIRLSIGRQADTLTQFDLTAIVKGAEFIRFSLLYSSQLKTYFKHIIHSDFHTWNSRGGQSEVGWHVSAAIFQPNVDSLPRELRAGKRCR